MCNKIIRLVGHLRSCQLALLSSILHCECVCVCASVYPRSCSWITLCLPALQWVYSSRVLQRTGLMTSSRDMKRLCPPATRILQPGCVSLCLCVFILLAGGWQQCHSSYMLPERKQNLNMLAHAYLILCGICEGISHVWRRTHTSMKARWVSHPRFRPKMPFFHCR